AYNPREWVTEIDYAGKFSSELTYDLAGNVTRQMYSHGSAASRTADYAYDNLYRITGFDLTGGTSRDYAYDRSGNLTSLVTGNSRLIYNYSGTSTPNRLDSTTGTAGQTYTYNQNGSVTSVGGNALSYDYRGLVMGYGQSNTYTRDSEGHRVKKTRPGGTTYYLRGAGGAVLAEYNSGGTLTSSYFYTGGDRLARLANGAMHYYLKDHLGSTRILLSSSGTAAATYDYWPYGEVLATGGTDATPFKFTGHERDAESGLDFMQYRTYEPDRMRFLQMDPRAEKYPGLSPYVYAGNNPLRFVDARGDTLDVGGLNKGKKALSYIHSMFDEETAKRITMGAGGRVSFDTEGLDLSQDSALELLDNLINSSENYLFEVARTAEGRFRNSGKDPFSGKIHNAGDPRFMKLNPDNRGIKVYSRTPERILNGVNMGLLPKYGYGGQVVLAPGSWTSGHGNPIPVGDVTFHELSEAFYRTDKEMLYPQAHGQALRDAQRHNNRGVSPSELDKGVNFHLEP
ncbi:MAG: RHS repeat-associated core domain-containing protein, partial [Gemmatimonadetes bacterium]|nr:RHS repeat-associated core domain-containing protein [Gemmatimonadota bacterium]MYG17421.1 RHS repeat-associated core domain-containing protein [Gemmatimonadota bacterium]